MIEIPEAFHISSQITATLSGKRIGSAQAAFSAHKFAWYESDPVDYADLLVGKTVVSAQPVGGMIEISLGDVLIVLSEGAYPRIHQAGDKLPHKHQLLIVFHDQSLLSVSVRMYGGVLAFELGKGKNKYYLLAQKKPSPWHGVFDSAYFDELINQAGMEKLGAKAFLATEQRIPGLGNGTLQDVLYFAGGESENKDI